MLRRIVSAICIFSFIGLLPAFARQTPVGLLFKDRQPIKVFIKDVVNESDEDEVSAEVFQQSLRQSLIDRKLIQFEVVDNPLASDIQISAAIKYYRYSERGTLKPIPGVTILVDAVAALTENYAEISAEYTVTDTKTDKTLWHGTISDNLKKVMTPEESIPLMCDKISRTFVWKCFGRKQDLERGD